MVPGARAFPPVFRSIPRPLVLLLAASAVGAHARSQSTTFLVPSRFEAASGSKLEVHVELGAGGALSPAAWPSGALEQFYVRTAGTQWNLPDAAPARPEDAFVAVDLGDPDAAMIGLDRRPWIESVPGAKLREFLEKNVEASSLPEGWKARTEADNLRVRHLDSAKLLVRSLRGATVGEPERLPGSATSASRAGQRSEIKVIVDPTVMALGSDLPLRVSWSDSKDPDATILALHVPSGTASSVRAQRGNGWIRIDRAGRWQLEVHRARRLAEDAGADFEIETATLVFSVPEPRKSPGRGR
jgi:hypothetical protein